MWVACFLVPLEPVGLDRLAEADGGGEVVGHQGEVALAQRDATIKRLSSTPSTGQTWF